MNEKLKLFVWENVLNDYTPGIMFALAPDVETARQILLQGTPYIPGEDLAQEPQVFTDNSVAFAIWGGG